MKRTAGEDGLKRRLRWELVVDVVAVVWILLFVVDFGFTYGLYSLDGSTVSSVRLALKLLLVVFISDVLLLYLRSDGDLGAFVRANWFYILTVLPLFRPLRPLRAARVSRSLRLVVRSRRLGSFLNKIRRMLKRAWERLLG